MKKSATAATAPTNPHHGLSFFKPKMKSGRGAKYKKKKAKKVDNQKVKKFFKYQC